ncbi:uncharacterized protein LOC110268281 isoform X6 [Arachis ipaensis]|uniref:uncharacterized protein LOC110268281 isoform X5 n=1 Tax=Arachis ipaensis TaxID=130454 RepID=UPI000A2B7648|nr:uncharacterized protein LOC110268281 isoform X5 [Arachis ipaensis]XP_020969883.1 uncharacterized protein LOC110268281 isoform X6 [Arachis ipaensis]
MKRVEVESTTLVPLGKQRKKYFWLVIKAQLSASVISVFAKNYGIWSLNNLTITQFPSPNHPYSPPIEEPSTVTCSSRNSL